MRQAPMSGYWMTSWRALVAALLVAALCLPATALVLAKGLTWALVAAQTLSLLMVGTAGAVYARVYTHRVSARLREAMWAITRAEGAAGQIERFGDHPARLDHLAGEIEAIKLAITRERSNVSMIASGMGVLRSRLEAERGNLGDIANGLHEVRVQLAATQETMVDVGEQFTVEQNNLGMVAGALDAVRRSVVGVDRVHAKQSQFASLLIEIADRIDAIEGTTTGNARIERECVEPRRTAKANRRQV